MDPITAAGIGLSVTSLALQVFSGCIKGYQMFVDVVGMPKEYEHLRTRLRMEQTRCLLWGEKVGLVEDLLDEPSKLLQLNGNLVLDLLHQIQISFRSCLILTSKYDPVIARSHSRISEATGYRPVSAKASFLQKTLAVWDRGSRIVSKVEWAMIRRGGLERLVSQLIQYNDRIEGLLDRHALDDIRVSQFQSHLALLQMAGRIDEIESLLSAMHFHQNHHEDVALPWQLSNASTAHENGGRGSNMVASLAVFKAHHLRIELDPAPGEGLGIPFTELSFTGEPLYFGRQSGYLNTRSVWLEWREDIDQAMSRQDYERTVTKRVKKLAAILAAPDRPKAFRSPKCLGYCRSSLNTKSRYALIYEWPKDINDAEEGFATLRELLRDAKAPPLDARLAMAKTLAASLLYLHAVEWVHKDIRSDSVLFASSTDGSVNPDPLLSGFEFARPSLPEQVTIPHQFSAQHDLYRHPDLQKPNPERSRKVHDIYSLGLVLAEIALWQPIEAIAGIEVRRRYLADLQPNLLDDSRGVFRSIAERAGWTYADIVRDCLSGRPAFGLPHGADDEESENAVHLTNSFYRQVVQKLERIKI